MTQEHQEQYEWDAPATPITPRHALWLFQPLDVVTDTIAYEHEIEYAPPADGALVIQESNATD